MTEKLYHAFSRFSGQFKCHVCSQENGVGYGLGTRLYYTTSEMKQRGKSIDVEA